MSRLLDNGNDGMKAFKYFLMGKEAVVEEDDDSQVKYLDPNSDAYDPLLYHDSHSHMRRSGTP